jgi:hypothetical protein
MDRRKWGRPSPAIIVAVMTLVAALAGTAIAGPNATTSVSKKQTKKIAKKQANKAVGNALPIGAEDLSEITTEEESTTINNNQQASLSPTCSDDQKVISGGGKFNDAPANNNNLDIQATHRDGAGWRTIFSNRSGTNNRTVTAYVYCLTG